MTPTLPHEQSRVGTEPWTVSAWMDWLKAHPECHKAAYDPRMLIVLLDDGSTAIQRNDEECLASDPDFADEDAAQLALNAGIPVSLEPPFRIGTDGR